MNRTILLEIAYNSFIQGKQYFNWRNNTSLTGKSLISNSPIRKSPIGGEAMPMQARSRYYPRLADAKLSLRLRLANC